MTKEELKEYCDDELKSIEKVISELFTIFSAENGKEFTNNLLNAFQFIIAVFFKFFFGHRINPPPATFLLPYCA